MAFTARLRVESAHQALRLIWREEIRLWEAVPYYLRLLGERDRMAELGFWQARAWRDIDFSADPFVPGALCGERFFFGNQAIPARIAALYCS